MPRIATGYWNAKNTPSRARSSGVMAKRSFPSYSADPAVTVYAGCPARTWASVLLPEPFGPMLAWTSPTFTVRSTPFRISLSPTFARNPLTSSRAIVLSSAPQGASAHRALEVQAHREQLLGLHGELHREVQEDLLAEAVYDHVRRVLRRDPPLLAVEELVVPDLRGRRLVLELGRGLVHLDVGERVGPALVADQEGVALGVVPRVHRALVDLHPPAVRVLPVARADPLRDDRAPCVLPDVEHLRPRVRLLPVVRDRDGVALPDGVVPLEDTARILPGDRAPGLDLGPGDLRVPPEGLPALRDEVVDPALPVLVAGVPVLDRGVLHLAVVQGDELDDRRVELVLVAHRSGAVVDREPLHKVRVRITTGLEVVHHPRVRLAGNPSDRDQEVPVPELGGVTPRVLVKHDPVPLL